MNDSAQISDGAHVDCIRVSFGLDYVFAAANRVWIPARNGQAHPSEVWLSPDKQEKATATVLEQAEVLSMNWVAT